MLIRINKELIQSSWKYKPDSRQAGVYNGIHWMLMKKKQVADEMFRYTFMVTVYNSRGGSISGTRSIITGDEKDVRYLAEICLNDETPSTII